MKTNWKSLIDFDQATVEEFAQGDLSGRAFYDRFRNTEVGGEARSLLRNRGVVYARRLARKSLKRIA